MITFVYCCICLLIVCCQTTRIESEENYINNDLPNTSPEVKRLQCKVGSDVMMRCNNNNNNHTKEYITWDFKPCDRNYQEIHCKDKNMNTLEYSEGQWKKLDYNRHRKKLEIKNGTEENSGLYRCLYNDTIIKIYDVNFDVLSNKFVGPKPEVLSLMASSNPTIVPSSSVIIQCKMQSVLPPEVRWLKQCNSRLCDDDPSRLRYDGNCYCNLNTSNEAYLKSNNTYVSKLIIYNSRNFDSGTYVCVVLSPYGVNHKNITIKVGDIDISGSQDSFNSFSLLFLIPLFFVLVPCTIWLGFYRKKHKNRRHLNEHQKHRLIKSVVEL